MRQYGVFDILGPIMIGPSSSHTAGAARLGKIARIVAAGDISSVKCYLHGSFARTYRGHGTDKALTAGLIGMNPWDDNLRNSMEIARKQNIKIEFLETDLGDVHPNTVKFIISSTNGSKTEMVGSSIGGGNILVSEINGTKVEFTGNYPTLIISHYDIPGMIKNVCEVLYKYDINIAFMRVYRTRGKGSTAFMVLELDNIIQTELIDEIRGISRIREAVAINPVQGES
ncbi:MAG: L-serine ammonia-lyase, iron-sulfur-dependent subunit beta [Clostridium sp.]|jgi:L-serine dehydratase|uniref:L-serine ammonia-lyase, iron-sulfur-dependent subunit beta n=1 Tax=Clostridium sp. TaxID=1506 RepID=UPI0025BCDD0B|nr:L-serine ammonia-lyase, iron-sulfur-dependent subunit beta [Clostridium sp.]MCH3965240.1 L-serine ammonia-lyase, iron-sulfur-dependent subunit beta [Clostridium sp.]MCI1714460.1 L-serine ammonia-lyase, iron-sulfur-dependent subunit beta [Clostridium sp.]MCI1798722.1 L-serine ammonia-lyase, iron-sulfur-dependent subunit beta [Clostridium sp.]MCI1812547.1 L-serine ammonia-lyase, iron-sulfur-dependent subunit beta [Clostridium sp.]MCI1869532.1 L-serine ammonia-lyase, iron-sulfur-dependent subu